MAKGLRVERNPISIEIEGVRYDGRYGIHRGVMTVTYAGVDSKRTQVGGTPPEVLARMLLSELVQASLKSGA